MADTPPDPKKEMESWFVEGLEPSPMKKKPSPAPPPIAPKLPPVGPKPSPIGPKNAKPPRKDGLLLALVVVLALLAAGGYYFYKSYVHKPRIEEAALPKPAEEAPAPPAPEPKPEVRPAKKPANITGQPEQPQPAETPAPVVVEAPPKPKVEEPPAPASGILLWSGKVDKNGTIVIDGGKSDSGTVNGAALPGVPVTVRVEPKGFTVSDPPSAANGWK